MKRTKRLYGLASLLFLVMGMGVYLFFRDTNMTLFDWIPKPKILETLFIPTTPSVFSSFALYHAPDMLWVLSGILFLRFLWFYDRKWQRVYIVCFYGIASAVECSQLSKRVPGTFDILDLLFMGVAAFIEGVLYTILTRRSFV